MRIFPRVLCVPFAVFVLLLARFSCLFFFFSSVCWSFWFDRVWLAEWMQRRGILVVNWKHDTWSGETKGTRGSNWKWYLVTTFRQPCPNNLPFSTMLCPFIYTGCLETKCLYFCLESFFHSSPEPVASLFQNNFNIILNDSRLK